MSAKWQLLQIAIMQYHGWQMLLMAKVADGKYHRWQISQMANITDGKCHAVLGDAKEPFFDLLKRS